MTGRSELATVSLFRSRARIRGFMGAIVAVPNAAKRGLAAVRQAQREGMQAGFPDQLIVWDGGSAFIEWKSATGKLSLNQVEWLNRLSAWGFPAKVCIDPDDALDWLEGLGAPFAFPRRKAA